jgi:hypothetical protein
MQIISMYNAKSPKLMYRISRSWLPRKLLESKPYERKIGLILLNRQLRLQFVRTILMWSSMNDMVGQWWCYAPLTNLIP